MQTPASEPVVPIPPPPPSGAEKFLGMFIAAQVVFILTANFIPTFRLNQPLPPEANRREVAAHVRDGFQVIDGVMYRWAHLSGQLQGWALYSGVAHQATYLAVDVLCDGDASPVRMSSPNEPADPARFVRPFLTSRLGGYEFYMLPGLWDESIPPGDFEAARKKRTHSIRNGWPVLQAYLRWQLARFHAEHPGKTPRQVTLIARRYYLPAPGEPLGVWRGPVEQPLLRWHPGSMSEMLKVEIADPQTGQFKPLLWKDAQP